MLQGSNINIRNVCETGFNAGHSAATWLGANPIAHLWSFDLWNHGDAYAKGQYEYLNRLFPSRITITKGDSTQTIPKFFSEPVDDR